MLLNGTLHDAGVHAEIYTEARCSHHKAFVTTVISGPNATGAEGTGPSQTLNGCIVQGGHTISIGTLEENVLI